MQRIARPILACNRKVRWVSGPGGKEKFEGATFESDSLRVERARRIKIGSQLGLVTICVVWIYIIRFAEPPEVVLPNHVRIQRRKEELARIERGEQDGEVDSGK
eukprot:TRINITY_DN21406_c0_g1_i1.p1 TRINITY_DN21406_c0_g1~~TRINITY_DN21406_c0_g1_i1.p1  ORF type:complete len:121 (+),score=20.89 TRINITY_DN21406_c0_g1_i1:53-364(+)